MGGPREGAGDDAKGRHSLCLGDHCVVETPRRAGPSIRHAVDYHVALLGQRVQRLGGAGRAVAEFMGVDDLVRAVVVDQDVLEFVQEGVGVVFAVLQEADYLAAKTGKVGIEALFLGHILGAGVEDANGVP